MAETPWPQLDDRPGPALPPASDVSMWAERAAAHMTTPAKRARTRSKRIPLLLLAAVVLTAGGVGATLWSQQRLESTDHQRLTADSQEMASSSPVQSFARHSESAAAPASPPEDVLNPHAARPSRNGFTPAPSASARPPVLEPPPAETTASREDSSRPATPGGSARMPPAPADLLEQANRLRANRHWEQAHRTYLHIVQTHPGTAQAHVATLAAAQLRLDHLGDAAGALKLYRAAQGRSSLQVEALFGTARCYRALGESELEARALQRIVDEHPNSLWSDRAQGRLQKLESR